MFAARRWSSVLLSGVVTCACLLVGCEVFRSSSSTTQKTDKLPALQAHPDSIQLEIVFLERPTGDRLMNESLWNEVATVLDIEPEEQRDLEKNGFRIGHTGSHPPASLQKLLEMKAGPNLPQDPTIPQQSTDDQKLQGKRIFIRSGEFSQIQMNELPYPEIAFQVFESHNSPRSETKRYSNAKCLYHLSVVREQPGWARLEFTPEIHYGSEQLRPTAGASGWELSAAPLIERMPQHRFSVLLNTGDMALVTGRPEHPGTIGHRFFTGPEGSDSLQRMLLVRLAQVGGAESPYATSSKR